MSGAALPLGWAATAHPFRAADPVQAGPGSERALVGLRPQGTGGSHDGGFPAERRINKTIMQTGACLLRPHTVWRASRHV